MPRAPRIEFENAIYHVMARGDRREPIVFSDEDRTTFQRTLAEACEKTGWEVFAWVLMDNHYHLALRTPEANLVHGMTWFQNTFTRRINIANGLWGHLFGGRYKAVLVENEEHSSSQTVWSDYLTTLIDYIHLNPARAGIADGSETSLVEYPWSSLRSGYAVPPSKRAKWLVAEEGLSLLGESDTTRGRKRNVERLDRWIVAEQSEKVGHVEKEGQSLQSTLQRGWYWGTQEFREKILDRFGTAAGEKKHRDNRSSAFAKDHGIRKAEQLLEEALEHFEVDTSELQKTIRGDQKRAAVAWRIWKETTVPQSWLVDRLGLSSAANVSHVVRRFDETAEEELERKVKQWKALSNHVA